MTPLSLYLFRRRGQQVNHYKVNRRLQQLPWRKVLTDSHTTLEALSRRGHLSSCLYHLPTYLAPLPPRLRSRTTVFNQQIPNRMNTRRPASPFVDQHLIPQQQQQQESFTMANRQSPPSPMPDPNRNRLPSLDEVLNRTTAPPVDLFCFYIYMRDQQRSVDYLDFWSVCSAGLL